MRETSASDYPDRMNSFLTTEHFALQSARGMINGEIISRVNIYFMTLSSVLIASGFLAQRPDTSPLFGLFVSIAFPVTVLLGLFTLARVMVLSRMDYVYLRAINRVRQFYAQAAPGVESFLLFPPHDDDRSVSSYGGYSMGFRGNLLSAANAVTVTNSIVATVLLSALLSRSTGINAASFVPYGILILVLVYPLHGFLSQTLARTDLRPEYREVRFPAPPSTPEGNAGMGERDDGSNESGGLA